LVVVYYKVILKYFSAVSEEKFRKILCQDWWSRDGAVSDEMDDRGVEFESR
jgi:hypothetical protein